MRGTAIVTKSDANFYPGAMALVRSIMTVGDPDSIIVFDCGLSGDQCDTLTRLGCEVISIDLRHRSRPATLVGTNYNDSIYALMHIPRISASRFLHLDADTIVFPRVIEMIHALQNGPFVGVPDHPALTILDNVGGKEQAMAVDLLFGRKFDFSRRGLNAGVFAANTEFFCELVGYMEAAYASNLELPLRDQSLLNIGLLASQVEPQMFDVHFNFRHHFRRDPTLRFEGVSKGATGKFIPNWQGRDIAVLHFVGMEKPWHTGFDKGNSAYPVWAQYAGAK